MQNICNNTLVSRVSTTRLTQGKHYHTIKLNNFMVVMDNDGREYRLSEDKLARYFNRPILDSYDMGMRRLENPACTCGAWSVENSTHSDWCDY